MKLRTQIVVTAISLVAASACALGQPGPGKTDTPLQPYSMHAAFSRDGTLLRVVGVSDDVVTRQQHVRAVTYSGSSGAVIQTIDLQPDTSVDSVTTYGETAIVTAGRSSGHPHSFVVDTATGHEVAIPDSWIQDDQDDAAISGDGRLISIYSEEDSTTPMVVTVYDWRTRGMVARRTSDYVSAGGAVGGGVTEDGEIEFSGNRVGSKIVDLKTGREMAQFGPGAVRSPDGKLAVQFPDLNWDESSSEDVLVKNGRNGRTIGKLDLRTTESEQFGSISGAFCGSSGRFVVVRTGKIAVYTLASGKLLAAFPADVWRGGEPKDELFATVACSAAGTRVAILSGARLTFHDLN